MTSMSSHVIICNITDTKIAELCCISGGERATGELKTNNETHT